MLEMLLHVRQLCEPKTTSRNSHIVAEVPLTVHCQMHIQLNVTYLLEDLQIHFRLIDLPFPRLTLGRCLRWPKSSAIADIFIPQSQNRSARRAHASRPKDHRNGRIVPPTRRQRTTSHNTEARRASSRHPGAWNPNRRVGHSISSHSRPLTACG